MFGLNRAPAKAGAYGTLLGGALAAVLAIGGISASSATAAVPCLENSVNVQGMGASLERSAQELWTGREVTTTLPSGFELPNLKTSGGYAAKCSPPTTTRSPLPRWAASRH